MLFRAQRTLLSQQQHAAYLVLLLVALPQAELPRQPLPCCFVNLLGAAGTLLACASVTGSQSYV